MSIALDMQSPSSASLPGAMPTTDPIHSQLIREGELAAKTLPSGSRKGPERRSESSVVWWTVKNGDGGT